MSSNMILSSSLTTIQEDILNGITLESAIPKQGKPIGLTSSI